MFTRVACLAGLAVFMAHAVSPVHAGDVLTSDDIIRLTPGTFQAVVKGKYELTVTLNRNGSAIGRVPGLEDRGRWTVRGNQLCILLPTWTKGRVECSAVKADNGWYRGRGVAFRKL